MYSHIVTKIDAIKANGSLQKKGAEKVDNSKNKKPQVSSFPPYIAALLG